MFSVKLFRKPKKIFQKRGKKFLFKEKSGIFASISKNKFIKSNKKYISNALFLKSWMQK